MHRSLRIEKSARGAGSTPAAAPEFRRVAIIAEAIVGERVDVVAAPRHVATFVTHSKSRDQRPVHCAALSAEGLQTDVAAARWLVRSGEHLGARRTRRWRRSRRPRVAQGLEERQRALRCPIDAHCARVPGAVGLASVGASRGGAHAFVLRAKAMVAVGSGRFGAVVSIKVAPAAAMVMSRLFPGGASMVLTYSRRRIEDTRQSRTRAVAAPRPRAAPAPRRRQSQRSQSKATRRPARAGFVAARSSRAGSHVP